MAKVCKHCGLPEAKHYNPAPLLPSVAAPSVVAKEEDAPNKDKKRIVVDVDDEELSHLEQAEARKKFIAAQLDGIRPRLIQAMADYIIPKLACPFAPSIKRENPRVKSFSSLFTWEAC